MTCVPCKILEDLECTNIMAYLVENKLLSDRQHAFRKNHSCDTQLIVVINDWAKSLDAGDQANTFILDFKKVHELLKCKLHEYVISGKTLVWVDLFPCNSQQRIVVNGAHLNGRLLCLVCRRALFSVPCCFFLCINDIMVGIESVC